MNTTMQHEIQALSYYCSNGLKLMSAIEDATGRTKMFHEIYPDLEKRFWDANDSRNLEELKLQYRRLVAIHDEVTMD